MSLKKPGCEGIGRVSIQARLLSLTLSVLLLVVLITAWLGYSMAMHEADELMDAQLAQQARIIYALGHDSDDQPVVLPDEPTVSYESRLFFQIWEDEDGKAELIMRSSGAPLVWPENVAHNGYSFTRIDSRVFRCFALQGASGKRAVLAAFNVEIRDEMAGYIALSNLRPYLLGMPILALLLVLVIRKALSPLRRLEAELANRSADRLDNLDESATPRELHPLVRGMNHLFARIARTLENERRFTSDAAHELRTPLAALRMQLQVAQRTGEEEERQSSLRKAVRGCDRMTHLVAQLLSLARLETDSAQIGLSPLDLGGLVREVMAEMQGSAGARGLVLSAQVATLPPVLGNADLLSMLLRNLIGNALNYVPEGGHIEVHLQTLNGESVLQVMDDGPGVAPQEREKLGLRFHRFGVQSTDGVGLGLSIVRRIAELHSARIVFESGLNGQGLGVRITFAASGHVPR